ncbi:UMP kinase [Candidatus Woesearchaeota archaeon]|nr:UMP kinase [Candidatus Woesearchaeota archaeon]
MGIIVFSVGGSLIVPDTINPSFLSSFQKLIVQLKKKHSIVLVTGGGKIARDYITAIRKFTPDERFSSLVGIASTKLNASLVAGLFGHFHLVPDSLQEVRKSLELHNLVVCGALGFQPNMTSDGDAALIASYLKADFFVNLTNVDGLYDKDPHAFKNAKLLKTISFRDFLKMANAIVYTPGQHFVLDQAAAQLIAREKIATYILNGHDLKNVLSALSGKSFTGTRIYG